MLFLAYAKNEVKVSRPCKYRRIEHAPDCSLYKPAHVPEDELREVVLSMDEFEALRLADREGMYQADAARRMQVSRQTLGNILKRARKKVADALVTGQAIRIENGGLTSKEGACLFCPKCRTGHHIYQEDEGKGICPRCQWNEKTSGGKSETLYSH